MKASLRPFSFLYDQVVELKNSFYDKKAARIFRAQVPVISIGNLTAGGTGKTPVTDFCLKLLVRDHKKVAVISRSYKADAGAPCPVDVSHPFAARYYGDEPVLLAQKNPAVFVFVGPSKWRTAQYAEGRDKYDVFVVDDGFQHRRLHRDLDIVILDATEKLENYAVLPEGRAREAWHNLNRADVLLISKCNLVDQAQLQALEAKLPSGKEVLKFGFEFGSFKNMQTQEVVGREKFVGKKLFLISAIARPDVFEKMMGDIGVIAKESTHYRDHYQYGEKEAALLKEAFKRSQADFIITTEKDVVKLKPLVKDLPVWSASLDIVELTRKGRLHEIVSQIFS